MKFQLLIKTKMLKTKVFLTLKLSDVVFILLINVKMPTIVLSMKFQLLIQIKMLKNIKKILHIKLSDVSIMLINAKMPTIVGILTIMIITFMSRINFMLS